MLQAPVITVLMPAYNAAKYIAPAIESVLEQTFTDFELLVIDDGSADETVSIVNSYMQKDKRIRMEKLSHQGIAPALNTGLQSSRGKYIARFDADDICYPYRLQKQYEYMTAHPDCVLCGCCADYITEEGEYVFTYRPPGFTYKEILAADIQICPFIHSGVMYVKEVILSYGGYDIEALSFEDHFLWSKLIHKEQCCNLPKALIQVRLNPQSVTMDERLRPAEFLAIKQKAIAGTTPSSDDVAILKKVLAQQKNSTLQQSAYHLLLGKKYLWNNYQPQKARTQLRLARSLQPGDRSVMFLLLLSYLPSSLIRKLYRWKGGHAQYA